MGKSLATLTTGPPAAPFFTSPQGLPLLVAELDCSEDGLGLATAGADCLLEGTKTPGVCAGDGLAVLIAEFGRGVFHPGELVDDGPFVVNLAVTSRDGCAVGVG